LSFAHAIGLGIAGNFAGHLEQAGEADDFVHLEIGDQKAPKGVFPFYVPRAPGRPVRHDDHFLHVYPISGDRIRLASLDEKHQIEPELALLCELEYADGRVIRVRPRAAMAHNDCSIRREGARKISEKKSWGAASKGTAPGRIPIDRFEPGGVLDHHRIACFLLRKSELHEYGQDSAVSSYSYFYDALLEWLVDRLCHQIDEGPLEDISHWLEVASRPSQALISVGATRYTAFGESHFLAPGDTSIVAVYDARRLDAEALRRHLLEDRSRPLEGASLLVQEVVAPE